MPNFKGRTAGGQSGQQAASARKRLAQQAKATALAAEAAARGISVQQLEAERRQEAAACCTRPNVIVTVYNRPEDPRDYISRSSSTVRSRNDSGFGWR